jgi:hypothetical protein
MAGTSPAMTRENPTSKLGDRPVDNAVRNLSTTLWIKCGKPVDDPVEKPVHIRCKSAEPFYEKAGYVPVDKAVHDRCVYG